MLANAPCVVARRTHELDIFVRAPDDTLWMRWFFDGVWSEWTQFSDGSKIYSTPAATQTQGEGILLCARTFDGYEARVWSDTTEWHGWLSWQLIEGADSMKSMAIVNMWQKKEILGGFSHLDYTVPWLFARGPDDAMWTSRGGKATSLGKETFGAWYKDEGLTLTSAPAVVSRRRGQVDVFVRGPDNAIWTKWYSNEDWENEFSFWGESGWNRLGGDCTSAPTVCAPGEGSLTLFVRGTDNALWTSWWSEDIGAWSEFASLGGELTSSPAATTKAPGQVDVFVRNSVGGVSTRWFQPKFGWSDWGDLGANLSDSPDADDFDSSPPPPTDKMPVRGRGPKESDLGT